MLCSVGLYSLSCGSYHDYFIGWYKFESWVPVRSSFNTYLLILLITTGIGIRDIGFHEICSNLGDTTDGENSKKYSK